jgi:hypothetical protein
MNDDQSAPPQVTTGVESNRDSRAIPFWRTLLVISIHWVLQIGFCAAARILDNRTSQIFIVLIPTDTLIQMLVLCSFAGMIFRTRFIFSWPVGFGLLSFVISCFLSALAINPLYPDFFEAYTSIKLMHIVIAVLGGICLLLWPIVCWKYELIRYSEERIAKEKNRFQFSIGWLFYSTFVMAILIVVLSKIRSDFAGRDPASEFVIWSICVAFWITWLINLYLTLLPKISCLLTVHINIICLMFVVLVFHFGSNPIHGYENVFFNVVVINVGIGLVYYLTCLSYRWAGWRIVKRPPTKAIYIESFLQQRP